MYTDGNKHKKNPGQVRCPFAYSNATELGLVANRCRQNLVHFTIVFTHMFKMLFCYEETSLHHTLCIKERYTTPHCEEFVVFTLFEQLKPRPKKNLEIRTWIRFLQRHFWFKVSFPVWSLERIHKLRMKDTIMYNSQRAIVVTFAAVAVIIIDVLLSSFLLSFWL
jgi:hypothetical protein